MVGILVATHGGLAAGLLDSASMIAGKPEFALAESLQPQDSPEGFRDRLAKAVHELDQGDGVLILTDLFGATPANSALYLLSDRVEVLTGVNLPMLLEAIMQREMPLQELADSILESARAGIINAGNMMRESQKGQ